MAPWRLEELSGAGGCELTLRVGRLFRVNVDVGTGAGRVTLAENSGVTPRGGCAFAAAVAGAPWAWNETSAEACGGDLAAVLQRVVPRLRRAKEVLDEAEECRSAFPRITRVRCTAGGDLEMSFTDFTMERKVDLALTMANGAYPRARCDRGSPSRTRGWVPFCPRRRRWIGHRPGTRGFGRQEAPRHLQAGGLGRGQG